MVDGYLASISRNLFDFVSKDWVNRRLMLNMVYTVAKGKGPRRRGRSVQRPKRLEGVPQPGCLSARVDS